MFHSYIRGKERGLGFLFRILLNKGEGLEVSAPSMPVNGEKQRNPTITTLALNLDLELIPDLPQKMEGPSAGYLIRVLQRPEAVKHNWWRSGKAFRGLLKRYQGSIEKVVGCGCLK